MCCCGRAVVNGTMGYRWQPKDAPGVYPASAPELGEGDALLVDEPGRCGGLDAHSYHFRLVRERWGALAILVRHGGGQERVLLSNGRVLEKCFDAMESHARFWLLSAIYHAQAHAATEAASATRRKWQEAAAEKRIKTRKRRGYNAVDVWIEARAPSAPEAAR